MKISLFEKLLKKLDFRVVLQTGQMVREKKNCDFC